LPSASIISVSNAARLWEKLNQLQVPDHVVRAKSQLLGVLLAQLEALSGAVQGYQERVKNFFASMPAAKLVKTLPGAKTGTMVAMLWAELGDCNNRSESFRHLQAEAGVVPVTKASGKSRTFVFLVTR
jgi:hypothetical protein